jgi:hypothetical protein
VTTVARWMVCDAGCKTRVVDVEDDAMMGYRNPDSGLGASVVVTVLVTVGFGRLFQLTGTRAGPGNF